MSSFTAFDLSIDDIKRLKSYVTQGMDQFRTLGSDLFDLCDENEATTHFEILKDQMKQVIKEEQDGACFVDAAEALKQQAKRQNLDPSTMKQFLSTAWQAAQAKSPNPEIHIAYKDLLKLVPTIEEGSSQDPMNDTMTVSEESRRWKDPITQGDIEVPVKNTVCGHVYDKNSISSYIKTTRAPKCPYLGCVNRRPLQMSEIVDDQYVMRILKERTMNE